MSVNLSGCFAIRLKGRFFYRMVDDSLPQWIRTYPEEAAPRTGDGLFPGEVIEVAQVKRSPPATPAYSSAAHDAVCNRPCFFSKYHGFVPAVVDRCCRKVCE